MRAASVLALAALLCGAGCASKNPDRRVPSKTWEPPAAEPAGKDPAAPRDPAAKGPSLEVARPAEALAVRDSDDGFGPETGRSVVRVGDRRVDLVDLVVHWWHHSSAEVEDMLDRLALEQLVMLEAERAGIRLDADAVEESVDEQLAGLEQELARHMPGRSIEDYIRQRLGQDPDRHVQRLRHYEIVRQLTPLVVRSWVLGSERARARMIVVQTRKEVEEVEAALAQNRPFVEVAREFSMDPEEELRGEPITVVQDASAMARMIFATPVGEVGGPFDQAGGYVLVEVLEREGPRQGPWTVMETTVRESLAREPLSGTEYMQWKEAMRLRYPIDYAPFLELVGEVTPQDSE